MKRMEAQSYSHWPLAEWLLVRALRRSKAEERRRAARLLGRMKSRLAVSALGACLSDSDASVRIAAAQALGNIRDARIIPLLNAAAANDSQAAVRHNALAAIGQIGYPAAARFLIEKISHPEDAAIAVRALALLLIVATPRYISNADLQAIAALENHALPPALLNSGHPSSPVGASWRHAQRLAIEELAHRQQSQETRAGDTNHKARDATRCIA